MQRSKRIILLSNCILNSNAKVEGLAKYKGALKDIVKNLIDLEYGIIQLPCPEMQLYGIKRWGHVKEQFDTPYFRKNCQVILAPIIDQIVDYTRNGYIFEAVIGIDGSPSCGVNMTCSSVHWGGEVANEYGIQDKIKDIKLIQGQGVFMEELKIALSVHKIEIPFIAVDEGNTASSTKEIIKYLRGEI